MSIQSEISRLATAKSALKTAINAKGGALANESISAYAAAVNGLQTGGCTVATAEAHNTAKSMSITFTGLAKEPKMFNCILKTSTSSSVVVSLTTDGTNTYSILGTTYKDDAFTWEYTNGSLTITLAAKYYSWYFAYSTRQGSYVYYELIYAY